MEEGREEEERERGKEEEREEEEEKGRDANEGTCKTKESDSKR